MDVQQAEHSKFSLPGGVKVARRPVKPFGVGASPTLAANFWKAGRYKLAAPVPKTGSAYRGGWSVTSAFRQFNPQPNHTHDHQPIIAEVAGAEIRQTTAPTDDVGGAEAATVVANPAETKAARSLSRRRQPTGLPHPVAPVIVPYPTSTPTKGNSMKPILRYRSQLLFRQSMPPKRILRIRPTKLKFVFRPSRFGVKPTITEYECE